MSLQSFANQRRQSTIGGGRTSMIGDFVAGTTTTPSIQPIVKERTSKLGTTWNWLSKQLMKPVGVVASEVEALGTLIGTGKVYVPGKAGLDVLSGKREYSFGKMWTEYGTQMGMSPKVAGSIGFVLDIVDDPFTWIGGGLTKAGKLAKKVSSLTKAGKVIKPTGRGAIKTFFLGEDIATQVAKSGYTIKELTLAGTKLEQVAKGQRALITALGRPIIGGTKVYKATERLGQITRATRIAGGLRRTFTTKTGIKYLDEATDNFKNLSDYRKQQVMDKAIDIQKQMKGMKPAEIKMIAEVIENPDILVKNKTIVKMASEIEDLFKGLKKSERARGVLKTELENYFPHIKAKEALSNRIKHFFSPKVYNTTLGAAKARKITGTVAEINVRFGKEFFQTNPAITYAQRGLASAKAVTAREFLDDIGKKFFVNAENAPLRYVDSTNPLFKGLRAEPEVVRAVDQYIQGIQPEDLKLVVRGFDKVQNWWKGQVLISPSYHIRNMVGNFWNNFLAGVKNPIRYEQARRLQGKKKAVNFITEAGEQVSGLKMFKEAQKRRVLGRGWYGSDIAQALDGTLDRAKKYKNILPWEQENILFKTNRRVGTAIEDNARLAHFIDKVVKGFSYDDAARSVKTFLFDYADLSPTERSLIKRVFPFYTWTRKNLPLQLENLIVQPEKFALVPKIIERIEAGVAEPRDEKYMSSYITDNIPVRIRTNEKGNTEYFLLGNWLPFASAIDLLSNPFQNIVNMVTPIAKTPFELWANKSFFFKNTLGEPSKIEYYYKQPTEFVGLTVRKKTAHLMRNIRILNDINKWTKTPAKDEPENSIWIKVLDTLVGKAVTYDIRRSKQFFQRETQARITELEAAIKKASKLGDKEQAQKLKEELKTFKKERRQ